MMSGSAFHNVIHDDAQAIDDCWNRIGVHGDKSCPLLAEHIHCRNCSVYSAAATRLLDRYALQQDDRDLAHAPVDIDVATRSLLVFRLGEEWLALTTRSLVEVAPLQPIHSLPHQRSRALLGVANVRGALVACLSLVELLGLEPGAATTAGGRVMPRMLIVAAQGADRWWCRWTKWTAFMPSTNASWRLLRSPAANTPVAYCITKGAACAGWMSNSYCPP